MCLTTTGICESHTVRSEKTSHEPFHRCCTCPGKSRMKYHGQCMVARNRADDIGIRFGKPIIAPSCQYVFGVDILVYKVSKKACLNKSLQKPSSRKQQLPDCISTESSSAEARLKNFTGDSRYDFCCCAVSSTHCYLQCLLRALSWVVAHPDTSATHRSSESSSSSSSSSSSVVTSVYNT